ncbi:LLM class flavin-dependent oxidoreductase [Mycobacterium sp. 236(2023)]|uniref:LLM class flavin-dependent oxidoreductase n=1 Tax=Mycobacterium sp. 236(2023) TaxID=3038163 RepID=UPI0024150E4A|nr:LLM class flavin-dependent oxidoreductase [Mycobacterium sp. 236(2023)]MDG4667616.1 LLM class flavin-dependent oxidoreductase [Mycobacterium sp. 236(2023)]
MTELSVLDQVPIPRGSTAGAAIRSSVELASYVEDLGFRGYWFAEHHLDQGRASSAPAILIALAIEATRTITLGSAATVLPFHTSLEVAEEFGSLAAVAPGRVVLGLGRSKQGYGKSAPYREISEILATVTAQPGSQEYDVHVAANGSDFLFELLGYLSNAPLTVPDDESRIREILNYLERPVAVVGGEEYRVSPGYQEDLGLAVFGGESGWSATIAAKFGLPLYVNAHSIKNDIVGTVARYRDNFEPSKRLASPYVGVSAHAIAAESTEKGRALEETFLRTLTSLRSRGAYLPSEPPTGDGFVTPDNQTFADSRALSFAGDAGSVVERLRALSDSVSADELLVSTIVYSPDDRRNSYRLIAENWN